MGVGFYEPYVELAERVGSTLGNGLTQAFFCQSGTEAVEAALKLAKYVTGKKTVVAFKGGFHGRTMGALSLTTSKEKYRLAYEPLVPQSVFFPYPYFYRYPYLHYYRRRSEYRRKSKPWQLLR